MGKLSGVMSSNPPQLSLSYDDGGERLQGTGLEGAGQRKVSGKREMEGEGPEEFERRQTNKASKRTEGGRPGAKGRG